LRRGQSHPASVLLPDVAMQTHHQPRQHRGGQDGVTELEAGRVVAGPVKNGAVGVEQGGDEPPPVGQIFAGA
jgi:hypothetical protein